MAKRTAKPKLSRRTRKKKTPAKSPEPPAPPAEPPLVEQEHGGALMRGGNFGNAGGGRPKDEIRMVCEEALREAKGIEVVKHIISGDIHELVGHSKDGAPIYAETRNKDRLTAVGLLMDRAYGKAPQKIDVSGTGTQGTESGEAVMQRLLAMIGRALLAAPAAQRLQVISEIERAEVISST